MAPTAPPKAPSPASPPRVTWRTNDLRRASRTGALISLTVSLLLLGLVGTSVALGDRSVVTLIALVFSLFLIDGALTRLLASARAPLAIGTSRDAVHLRTPKGEQSFPWKEIADIRFTSIGPRPDTMAITMRTGDVVTLQGVLSTIATEVKLAWLEASTLDAGSRRGAPGPASGAPRAEAFHDLAPSRAPQYWDGAKSPEGGPQPSLPEWAYTRAPDGAAVADVRYSAPPGSVRPFVWHFIPGASARLSGVFLIMTLGLATFAAARMGAEALMAASGLPPDPVTSSAFGLAAGLALAAALWRRLNGALSGEVADSVLFLPAFDRTKGEIVSSLFDAGARVGVGPGRERRTRGRLVVRWPSAHTRATVMQASPETRAIVLRTVGASNFDLHARFKGAILERLRGPGLKR